MSAKASVFYGVEANTWSLLKAAKSHKLIAPQILALDLLILRQTNGSLSSSTNRPLSKCPVEIFILIKDEVYAQGLASVLRKWTNEYVQFVRGGWESFDLNEEEFHWDDSDYGSEYNESDSDHGYGASYARFQQAQKEAEFVKRRCKRAARMILSSKDWEKWASRDEFTQFEDDYDTGGYEAWDYESDASHATGGLHHGLANADITEFLKIFGLRLISEFNVDSKSRSISDLYLPVSLCLAHPNKAGINLEASSYEGHTSKVLNLESLNEELADSSFKVLFEKYHVEFDNIVDEVASAKSESHSGSVAKGGEKKKEVTFVHKMSPPQPGWKLHCGLYTER